MRHSGIILAINPRINIGILTGIMRAAQQSNSIVIFELARSECNLERGYTGLTPSTFAENIRNAAKEVNFIDYVIHADHTTLTRGDDEDIGRRVGGEMALLRHQRPEDRHQLCGGDIVHLHHARNHLVTAHRRLVTDRRYAILLGIDVGYDFDHLAARHGSETMHLEDGEKHLVDLVAVHRPGRDHGHLALHPGVYDEVSVGDLGDRADQGADIGILQVQGHGLGQHLAGMGQPQQGGQQQLREWFHLCIQTFPAPQGDPIS